MPTYQKSPEHQTAPDKPTQQRATAHPSAAPLSETLSPQNIAHLQRTIGNRAVQRRIQALHAPSNVIQRGEAGVHHDIENEALGVDPDFVGPPTEEQADQEQSAQEVYVGNWMRDYSQLFVPTVFENVREIPSAVGDPGSQAIGAAGAESLLVGLLRALASLEFDPEIVDNVITGQNIGVYQPEEHMDNPAGMAGGDVLIRDSEGNLQTGDADSVQSQMPGSAVGGGQVENPQLYGVSAEGLAAHIYNTKELIKNKFLESYTAAAGGDTRRARMLLGTGLHGIEDYYSHSNFIEVALNIVLQENPGALAPALQNLPGSSQPAPGATGAMPVDTMYDVNVPENDITVPEAGGGSRQAITTGTFTSTDTKVSLAHVLLPKLPGLFSNIDQALDRTLLALEQPQNNRWADIRAGLQNEAAGRALLYLLDGMEQAGMTLPTYMIDRYIIPDLPDILPDMIEGLEGRWIPIGLTTEQRAPSAAIPYYQTFIQYAIEATRIAEDLQQSLGAAALLLERLGMSRLAAIFRKAGQFVDRSLKDLKEMFRQHLKQKVREVMFDLVESLTGVDVPAEKRENLEEWLGAVHHGVEGLSQESSLQSQLADEDSELSQLEGEDRQRRIPEGPLPPSHSEISKDHPSLEEHGVHADEHSVTGPDTESAFYTMHRQLALEADTHLINLMEAAWQASGSGASIVGGGHREMDESEMNVRDLEAQQAGQRAGQVAAQEGWNFAQSGNVPADMQPVLDAVDLYIGHPADSRWWRAIVMEYVNNHPAELAEQIRRRNAMYGERAHAH